MQKMHTIQAHLATRRDNFLLLRIIAALLVIYGHSFPLTRDIGATEIFLDSGWRIYSGDIAVDLFFVISGFMVSGSFMSRSSLSAYLSARLLRIVPAYAFILLACAFVIGPLLSSLAASAYFSSPEPLAYVAKNMRFSSDMAWTLPGVFQDHRLTTVNGALWTLPAEMRMYMLVAVMGVFGLLGNRIYGLIAVIGLMLAGLLNPELLPVHTDWIRLGGFFCLGILAQLFKDKMHIRNDAMLVMIALTYISYNTKSYPWLLSLSIAYFAFWFAYCTPVVNLQRFGDPSYGIYLWGWPAQQVVISMWPAVTPFVNFLFASLLAILMGYASWHVIERPALSLKDRFKRMGKHPLIVRAFSKPGANP